MAYKIIHKDYVFNKSGFKIGDLGCYLDETYKDLTDAQYESVNRVIFTFMKKYLTSSTDRKKLKLRDRTCNVLDDLHNRYNVITIRAVDVLQRLINTMKESKKLIPVILYCFEI